MKLDACAVCGAFWMVISVGCRPSSPPSASGAVLQIIDEDDAEALEKRAPEAFANAARYAALSEERQKVGDEREAKRFKILSQYYLKMAKLSQQKQVLERKISAIQNKNEQLDADIANTKIALDNFARIQERKRFRAHVEAVIDETRRRAAAEEAIRERGYTGKDKRAIRRAREQLGAALIERSYLFLDILAFSVPKTTSEADFLAPVANPISAAEAALEKVDLAQVQQYLENAGVAFQKQLSSIWQQSPFDPVVHTQSLLDELQQEGFSTWVEDVGISVLLPDESRPALYTELVNVLSRYPDVGLLLLSSWRATGEPKTESEKLASKVAESITSAGFPEARLHIRAVGEATPLQALTKGDIMSVLLLVPCPES